MHSVPDAVRTAAGRTPTLDAVTTTTFLFTDIEGSSRLWEEHEAAMRTALADHDRVIDESVAAHGGRIFSRMGDGVAAVFDSAIGAMGAAADIQRRLAEVDHQGVGRLLVRIGLHSGEAATSSIWASTVCAISGVPRRSIN